MRDVEYKHSIFGDAFKLSIAIAQMGTCFEATGTTDPHSLKAIAKPCDFVSVTDHEDTFFVTSKVIAAIELDGVSNPNAVALR